ncbi:N-acetylglucosaminyldiphosphodolichol N-acetylglucosaminyltransferase catalytic subunit alg13 [Bulinus truncatus]|nr:N-acetylglucosaminyldiphosphodolichol N-acetylglucosaminyltransferase catalytic subunit alg13 [Bulinus truncatus]
MGNRKRLFVTVGTTKFDSLIKEVTSNHVLLSLRKLGFTDVILQIGKGDYIPEASESDVPKISHYRFKDSTASDIAKADLVICHAGAGSIMDSLGAGKYVLVVINEELMDNHQTELAEKLSKEDFLYYCTVSTLQESLNSIDVSQLKPYPPGEPHKFVQCLDGLLGFA